ncbi:MAG: peptidoglycan bridge formation glycyltransferase FemA/FemB family protein [Clostridium sp.]|nr:peptidoglycan bridge formation glycyltransferase FemA/FemB family protein [Clostridium sp.]
MLIVSKKNKGIPIIDCWYAEHALAMDGVIRYQEAEKPIGAMPQKFETLLSDLKEDEETILSHYSKNCRYEVRRAPKEGVVCAAKCGKELTEQDIAAFTDFFEQFWASKGISYNEKEKCRAMMRQYVSAGAMAVTTASLGGKLLVYHTYILEEKRVRLYQSASQFRTDESITTNIVGFANRYLHYQDMLFFKKMGKEQYDWGGAGRTEDVESITKFKESFGGKTAVFYNGEEVRGAAPKLYRAATGFIGRLMSRKE